MGIRERVALDKSHNSLQINFPYDRNNISYERHLEYFWVHIDPFDYSGKFCDKGPSYRSPIFAVNDTERELAERSRWKVVERFSDEKFVTPILDASTFYPIKNDESYHQDFYKNNPVRYRVYRWNCGRDRRLKEIWGDTGTH